KTLSVAGKAGRLIDPMTYVGQAAGKAASLTFSKLKIGELLANIGKVDGAFLKVDDVVWNNLPKADAPGVTFPHPNDTARLPDDALGRPQYLDKVTGQLLDHNGLPKQELTAVPKGSDHPLAEVPTRQEATVGAHAHTPGGGVPHTSGGTADNMPHNSHTESGGGTGGHGATDTTPTSGDHADTPSTGGHGDDPGTGGGHGNNPTFPHQGSAGDSPVPDDGLPAVNTDPVPETKVRRRDESWPAGDDIVGNARGKTLLYPNPRHDFNGIRNGPPKEENTIILPGMKDVVRSEIAEIAAGRAYFDSDATRYILNGRTYAVESSGRTFPVSGPGFINLNRFEYSALKAIMRADGDWSKVAKMFEMDPNFRKYPDIPPRMFALYREYHP
ncbi:hypothetical protein ACFW6V_35445, partial [Streptomyces sp. NPDC058734]